MNHLRELLETKASNWYATANLTGALPRKIESRDVPILQNQVRTFGSRAMSFWLDDVTETKGMTVIPELCRLPFDACWFEWTGKDIGAVTYGVLVFAVKEKIRVIAFARVKKNWCLLFLREYETLSRPWFEKPDECGDERKPEAFMYIICSFLSALHCSNIKREEHAPEAKLQQSRASRGKAPLFSYWTLQLDGKSERGEDKGGTHASPRLHLRRGHPRQYAPDKWTWVQACAVGNKALGMVHKDYTAGPALLVPAR